MNLGDPTFSWEGKTVAILGTQRQNGLTWTTARMLRQAGARITLGYDPSSQRQVRLLLEREPCMGAYKCDTFRRSSLRQFLERFSKTGLDILIYSNEISDSCDLMSEEIRFNLTVNQALGVLKPSSCILILSSVDRGTRVTQNLGLKSLLRQLKPKKIRINRIAGCFWDPETQVNVRRAVKEASQCAVFFASVAAQKLTGKTVLFNLHSKAAELPLESMSGIPV